MTDPVPTPAIVAAYLTLLDQFAQDLATLCDKASANGLTGNMIIGQFEAVKFCVLMDNWNASQAAAPVVLPPAPAPTDVVYQDMSTTAWTMPGIPLKPVDLPSMQYPFSIGCWWRSPAGVDNPYCLLSIDTDTDRRMALYAQNDGSVMAQAMDASTPDQVATYGQAVLSGAAQPSKFVLSVAVFVSASERYVYSTGVGTSTTDTTPVDGAGSAFTLNVGNDSSKSHPFTGMIGAEFVMSRALVAADFAAMEASPPLFTGS